MPRADRVPFLPRHRLVAVEAVLNEQVSVTLVADPGAQQTLISPRVAQRLNLARPIRMQPLVGVGQSPPVPVVRLDRLRVGASAVGGLAVCVYELPALLAADGLLGLDFLRRYRVTFEFDTDTLVLRVPPRP
jgi:predicted aspartyl protease